MNTKLKAAVNQLWKIESRKSYGRTINTSSMHWVVVNLGTGEELPTRFRKYQTAQAALMKHAAKTA